LHDMRPIFIIKSCPSPNLQVKYYLNVKNKKKSLSNLFLESLISHTYTYYTTSYCCCRVSWLMSCKSLCLYCMHMCKQNVK
jgi:hypothetical protein